MSPVETLEKQYLRYRKTKAPKDLAPVFLGLAPQLMNAARRAGLDLQGAEDAVQETFLAFIAGEERFEEGRPMIPWVRGIALRQINAARRRRARLGAINPWDEATPAPDSTTGDASGASMERIELRRKIEAAIRTLSEGNQQVVSAALFEGLKIDEIATRLDLSHTATSVRLHRGLAQVRKKLGERSALGLVALTIPRAGHALPVSAFGGVSVAPAGILAAVVLAAACGFAWFSQAGDRLTGADDSAAEPRVAGATPGSPGLSIDSETPSDDVSLRERFAPETTELRVAHGMVRSESGRPALEGAEIFALQTDPEIVLPTAPLVPIAKTGPDGSFALELNAEGLLPTLTSDASPLLMVRSGREIGWIDVTGAALQSGQLPEIRLEQELELNVTITDEGGHPLEGVSVAAFSSVMRFLEPMGPRADEFGFPLVFNYRHLFGAVTDQQGSARVGGLFGAGDNSRMVVLTAKKPGYASAMVAYLLGSNGGVQADVVLPSIESLHMEGAVQSVGGEPLAGVELRFRVRGEAPMSDAVVATSDAMGRWVIPQQLLDEFPLYLALDQTGYTREEIVVNGASELDGEPFLVSMRPAERFRGVVLQANRAPVVGAEVTVATVRSLETMTTAADGTFECSVPADTNRSVTVISQDADSAARSIRLAAPAGASWLDVDLPEHLGVASEFVARLSAGESWSSASLVPDDVAGVMAPIEAELFNGSVARFDSVPHGRWILCGVTQEGRSVVMPVDVGDESAATESTRSIAAQMAEFGFLDCVIETDGGWAALAGGQGECRVVASYRGLPPLPASVFQSGDLMEVEAFLEGQVGEPLGFQGMLAGSWEVVAKGPGWTTLPMEVVVPPGGEVRVDLKPVPSATLQLQLPVVARSCLLRFSIRRSADDYWSVVAIPSIGAGLPDAFSVQLPEGRWLWRAEFVADNVGREFSDVAPPLYGRLDAKPGEPQPLRLLDGTVRP